MQDDQRELRIYQIFEIGVILKGINALAEIVLGTLLFFVNVGDIVQALVQNELVEDPNDFLATHLQPLAQSLTAGGQTYAAIYLLAHGVIKAFLVVGLLRRKLWAYPASLAVFALFVLYQVLKWLQTHSIALLLLTVFDIALIWLVWHEYRRMSRHHSFRS